MRIFPYSAQMRENTEKKLLRIWTLFTQGTGQRDQTIKCLNFDYKKISSDKVVLFVPGT